MGAPNGSDLFRGPLFGSGPHLFVVQPVQAPREAPQQLRLVLNLHGVVPPGGLLDHVHLGRGPRENVTETKQVLIVIAARYRGPSLGR